MNTDTLHDIENLLKLVLPVLIETNPQISSVVGIIALICSAVELIVKEYQSRKTSKTASITSNDKRSIASQIADRKSNH
jgi:hypothetical protein